MNPSTSVLTRALDSKYTLQLPLSVIFSFLNKPEFKAICNKAVCLIVNISLIFSQSILPYLLTTNVSHAADPFTATVDHIVVDGNTEAYTDRAQNNTPVLNIARPNGSGLSHNTFRDYNVLADNLIINNFKGGAANSQLGGSLYGNPNFNKAGGAPATIILNEVTSNNLTRLEGYTEIFGNRAALIIANPNGILTSGAGFINTSRLSLITGNSNINNTTGQIESFNINPNAQILITARDVTNGNGQIIPLGLDASTTDYSEIISRTVKVTGEIYGGRDLNIKTGNKNYNYQTKEVTSDTNNTNKPSISIDSSALGGMYGGTISFIATEDGVGVKAMGDLVSDIDDINIDINGTVTYKKLAATNNININVNNNDFELNDNSGELIANNTLNITANNIINNKAEFEATNNMSLIANNSIINNTILLAKNDLNLTTNKTTYINITDQTSGIHNFGDIAANNNLTITSKSIFNNHPNSTIFANNDLNLIVDKEILNNNSTIYSVNNIDIRSSIAGTDNLFKTDKIENVSGRIETLNGDIALRAKDLTNKREFLPTQGPNIHYRTAAGYAYNYAHPNHYYYYKYYYSEKQGEAAPISLIRSGTDLIIKANNLINNSSIIYAGNDANIDVDTLSNVSNTFRDYVFEMFGYLGNGWNPQVWNSYYSGTFDGHVNQAYIYSGKIIAKNNLTGTISTHIDNINITANYQNINDDVNAWDSSNINSLLGSTINVGNGAGNKLSPNPKYLYETRFKYLDLANFLGSEYFFTRLGINFDVDFAEAKLIGDASIEQKLVMDAINKVTNYEYLDDTITSDLEQMQALYDNAISTYDQHPELTVGKSLTQSQIDNLDKDIIWLVEQEIDGHKVLVPVVYLANDTLTRFQNKRNNNLGSVLKAGNDININVTNGDLESHLSSITAGNDIKLTSEEGNILIANSVLNSTNKTIINAKKNLQILSESNAIFVSPSSSSSTPNIKAAGVTDPTPKNDANTTRTSISTFNAGTDIQLTGANVTIANNTSQAGGSIFVTATAGNINNSNYQLIAGNNIVASATGDVNNIHTATGNNGQATLMQAGNAVSIDAGGNITNRGATIDGTNLVYLTAGGDINNEALIDRTINGQTATKAQVENSNADNITSTLVKKGEIKSTSGNVVLVAANNINNTASNITSGGQTYLEATSGDVNINTDTLRNRTVTTTGSKKRSTTTINDTTTNVGSNLDIASNLTLVSGNDTSIKGSDLTVGGSLTTDSTGNLSIESAQDTSYSFYANYKRGSFGRRSSSTSQSTKVTNVESNINVAGDINSRSEKNISIIASNLISNSGNINLIAKDQINILSATDTLETKTTSKKHGLTTIAKNDKTHKTVTQITSDLNANNGNISLSSGGNTTMIASNISSGNDTNIKVGSYIDSSNNEIINNDATLNILNAMDSQYDLEESSKLGMDAGAIVVGIAAGAVTGGIVGAVAGAYVGAQAQQGNIDMVETYDETIVASNITSGNNINIEVASGALIRSSELNSGNDVNIRVGSVTDKDNNIINTNSNANLNITSAEEQHIRNESHEKIKPDLVAVAGAAALSGAMISSGGILMVAGGISVAKASEDNALANRDMNESRLNKVDQISSDILTENDLNAISANNINIVASNVTSNSGDLNFTSGGKTNILSAIETSTLTTREEHQDFSDFSAGVDRGRASVGVNANISKETNSITESTVKSSNIAANNININSTNDVTIQASNIAANNNVDITSANGDVNLVSATNNIKNTQVKEELDATLSVGIGNAYVDTAYAVDDAAKAGEALKDAKEELSHMKNLHNQGRATDEAVKDSEISLALATVNFSIAAKLAAAAAINAAGAASTSFGTGFYGDVRMDMSGTKANTNESIVQNVASSIVAGNNVDLTSANKDINQKGSHIASINGDVTYTAGRDVNIEASKDTYDYKFGSETVNASVILASSNPASMVVDNLAGSLGYQKTDQAINSITYNNSTTTANNININSGNDTTAKGANILASNDLIINVGNDLIIESKQNEYHAKGSSKGLNIGAGKNNNTGKGNYSFGLNRSKSRTDKVWVDDQTTLVANNAVSITTNNNTDIKGALIANIKTDGIDGGNLNITTSTLTFEDIQDIESHYDKSLSGNLAIGRSEEQRLPNGVKNVQYGVNLHDTKVTFENNGYEKEQVTRATIGSGVINIADSSNSSDLLLLNRDTSKAQEITKDTITGNLKGEVSLETVVEGAQMAYEGAKLALVVTADTVNTTQSLINKAVFNPLAGGDINKPITQGAVYRNGNDHMAVIDPNGNVVTGFNTVGLVNKASESHPVGTPVNISPWYNPQNLYMEGGWGLTTLSKATNLGPGGKFHDGLTDGFINSIGGEKSLQGKVLGPVFAITTSPMAVLSAPTTIGLPQNYQPYQRTIGYFGNKINNNSLGSNGN